MLTRTIRPFLCLFAAVLLLSSITPVIKYVFQHSALHPISMASLRVTIGFFFLAVITLRWDREGPRAVASADKASLTLLGLLGVVSYAVAAWGLLYTSVTHYILIYSMLPCFTAVLGHLSGREDVSLAKLAGLLTSFAGGLIVIMSERRQDLGTGSVFGDWLVMLFTVMMAAYIVFSSGVVKRVRALPANLLMFGSGSLVLSFLMVSLGAVGWPVSVQEHFVPLTAVLVAYVGVATAAVFLLRYVALQSLTPVTVGVYHNLVPVGTILLAYLYLGEVVGGYTLLGGASIIAGAECVRRA
jgi:drug/metabolite transporter (DMT)-like permease